MVNWFTSHIVHLLGVRSIGFFEIFTEARKRLPNFAGTHIAFMSQRLRVSAPLRFTGNKTQRHKAARTLRKSLLVRFYNGSFALSSQPTKAICRTGQAVPFTFASHALRETRWFESNYSMNNSATHSIAWKNGVWLPTEHATLSMDDIGFLQGAVIVDRLRTCDGIPLDLPEHCRRFHENCSVIGIRPSTDSELELIVEACVHRNQQYFAGRDFSIVLLATPGTLHGNADQPTCIVHPAEIAWKRTAAWYRDGQQLITSEIRSVPNDCWATSIKTRSRLNYHLADRAAVAEAGDRYAAGVLIDEAGFLTETSTANLVIVEDNTLVSPPPSSILWGISLRRTLRLAEENEMEVLFERISPERAGRCEAILLTGSTGCLWVASRFDDRVFESPTTHPVFVQLRQAWEREIGFDFVQQASSYA